MKRFEMHQLKTVICLLSIIFILTNCGNTEEGSIKNKRDKILKQEIENMTLIEVHCHIDLGNDKIPGVMQQLISLQKQENLTYALWISPNHRNLFDEVRKNINFARAVPYINPQTHSVGYVDSLIKNDRDIISALKFHPTIDQYEITTALFDSFFILANQYNLPIVTHTDTVLSQAGKYLPLLIKYPETKLVLYHAAPATEAFKLVNLFPNVFIDVSYTAWGKEFQQKALKAIGKEKILYGIDSPLGFPKDGATYLPHYRDAAKEVAEFYDFDREVVEAVLYKNAMKLFNLKN